MMEYQNNTEEIWLPLPGLEEYHLISSLGIIKIKERFWFCRYNKNGTPIIRHNKERIVPQRLAFGGYMGATVYDNQQKKVIGVFVHIMVAKAFVPNPENKPEVNHKDGNKLNNAAYNLEWSTGKENSQHAVYIGLTKPTLGSINGMAKLNESQVLQLRSEAAAGVNFNDIAVKYGIHRRHVNHIVTRKSWKHI